MSFLVRNTRRFIDKFDGRGWKGDIKEYLLNCSKLNAIGWRAENNSNNAVISEC